MSVVAGETMPVPSSNESFQSAIVAISANQEFRERVVRALEACQCSALEANGGAEVLAHLDSASFDLAVLESNLPDLDAAEVLRFICEQNPDISYVIVNSVTGRLTGQHQLANQRARAFFEALQRTE